jgi:hypothetical protein
MYCKAIMLVSTRLICAVGFLCWSHGFGQSVLSLSSASGAPGGSVTLNVSLNTGYPGNSAGLQWTLNAPTPDVASFTTVASPGAVSAQKSLYCANQICLLVGLNSTPLSNGVVAIITLTLSPTASGNLVIQLSNPVEALLDGTGGSITAANGLVSVAAISGTVTLSPSAITLGAANTMQFTANVSNVSNSKVTWSLDPDVGSISGDGLYTPPNTYTQVSNSDS